MEHQTRREFLYQSAKLTGAVLLLPVVTSCTKNAGDDPRNVPFVSSPKWDSVAFNRVRGNAGAIPESYLKDINGPDGEKNHIGKHLPYIPSTVPGIVPKGYLPIMWGDPAKGYTPHPNAPPDASNNNQGHWYNWIRIRKATKWYAQTVESVYSNWPCTLPSDSGAYAVSGSGDITANNGIHTIYLAALPKDVSDGDVIRIWAHCLTHGEYIDFIKVRKPQIKYLV